MKSLSKLPKERLVVPAIIVLNLAITLTLSMILNIWEDDAFTLCTTARDVVYALRQALRFELQLPLFFVLLNLWRTLNHSVFFAQLFSILCISLTIVVVAEISRRLFERTHPGWACCLIAFNPFVVYAALEIRVYAFAILESALLLLLFVDGYLADASKALSRWSYILFAVLALYTQYYLGFLLVGNFVALLALRRWKMGRHYLAHMVLVGIFFLPLLWAVERQVSVHLPQVQRSQDMVRPALKFASKRIFDYVLPVPWAFPGFDKFYRLGGLVFLAFLFMRYRRYRNANVIALWTITAVISAFFMVLLNLIGNQLLEERHTAALFIPAVLAFFSVVQEASNRAILILACLVFVSSSALTLHRNYQPLAKWGDYIRVASFIQDFEKPNQCVLVFTADAALPLAYYYFGPNKLVPIPKEENCETFDLNRYVLNDEKEIWAALSRAGSDGKGIWVVSIVSPGRECGYWDVEFNCPVLEEFIGDYYRTELDKSFYTCRVRLLRRVRGSESAIE